ncbi:hypothetical protein [Microbispora rosea]|uniref:hypothetical protein n=1 Tax=Microbispora rosea TaxID=58117 RepID=UPI000690AC7E|nr:hypothetical protein [Microbispora rosea]
MIAHFRSYAQHRGQPAWSPCPKDMVRAALPREVWDHLEEHLKSETYEYLSDWARENIAKGKVEGQAEAILTVLSARGIEVSEGISEKIRKCHDLDRLAAWLRAAATIDSSDALFGDIS